MTNSTEKPRLIGLRHCPDVAFYGDGRAPDVREPRPGLTARIVVMDWQWSRSVNPARMTTYVRRMAALVDGLVENGFAVELGGHSVLPEHGQDDIVICDQVAAACSVPVKIDRDADVGHLWKRYRDVDVVVGTRLHACIMAVSVETPCVVLAYQEKGEAVMLTAGVPAAVFRVDDFDPKAVVAACEVACSAEWREDVAIGSRQARDAIVKMYSDY